MCWGGQARILFRSMQGSPAGLCLVFWIRFTDCAGGHLDHFKTCIVIYLAWTNGRVEALGAVVRMVAYSPKVCTAACNVREDSGLPTCCLRCTHEQGVG